MSSSMRGGTGIPGSSGGRSVGSTQHPAAAALSCNLCSKPLATTCFLCACDCIFCEDCTYSHFEHSSQCPTCRKTLGDQDFTELVVADASNGATDIAKSSMQAMFSKKNSGGYLPHSELCQSLIRQIDASKQNTKFLLKQLLVETHKQARGNAGALRVQEQLRMENTQLKQTVSSQRLQYEQTINDLQNKLKARESTIAELNQMLGKFQKHYGGKGPDSYSVGGASAPPHMVPNSSIGNDRQEPPLRGLLAQRKAQEMASQNAMNGRNMAHKQPFMNSMNTSNRGRSPGTNYRPFSSSSVGSGSSGTPRIRDLSANTGYHFTGVSNQQPLNKRRRGGTPTSIGTGPSHTAMSPTTAFTLNQGPHRPLFNSSHR
ncbi:hypothetical protein ACHAW6_005782 [Cyclotella cf. meneghiniana]